MWFLINLKQYTFFKIVRTVVAVTDQNNVCTVTDMYTLYLS